MTPAAESLWSMAVDRTRRWWRGRFGARALIEVALLVAAWKAYRLGRFMVRDQITGAVQNGADVIDLERMFGLGWEPHLQRFVLGLGDSIQGLNWYYAAVHFPLTIALLCLLYSARPEHYRHVRRALVGATGLGLIGHALYPLAPPRMMPELGMIDTLSVYGPQVYSHDVSASITNQFAAMPSMHVGWAVLMAYAVITGFRTRWRWLVVIHPVLMVLAVTATANHYLLDGIVGAALVALGITADRAATAALARRRLLPVVVSTPAA